MASSNGSVKKKESHSFKFDPEDITHGIQWRSEGQKQSYNFPEDIAGGQKRVDPRCQKCGSTVYPAERFTYEGVPYHKICARCLECNVKLSGSNAFPFGNEVFVCGTHYNKVLGKIKLVTKKDNSQRTTFEKTEDMTAGIEWKRSGNKQTYRFEEDRKKPNPRCNFCGKTSYNAERITYNGIPYHSNCFRCLRCGRKISGSDANPFGDVHYLCSNHYSQVVTKVGTGVKKRSGDVSAAKSAFVLEKDEYDLDPRMYKGHEWRVSNGKQTYNYPEDSKGVLNPRCNYCAKKCYPAEKVTYEKIPYHKKCFRCLKCGKSMTPANATPFGETVFLCDAHFVQYGQGGGLPTKGQDPIVNQPESKDESDDEYQNLSALERRRLRRKNQKGK